MVARVRLKFLEGPLAGNEFEFTRHETFIFGRGRECHARLPESDRTVSRHHFFLEINPPEAWVRDLGSLNGTYVNGFKIGARAKAEPAPSIHPEEYPQVRLQHGDKIKGGATVLEVLIEVKTSCILCNRDLGYQPLQGEFNELHVCDDCSSSGVVPGTGRTVGTVVKCRSCGKMMTLDKKRMICEECEGSSTPGNLVKLRNGKESDVILLETYTHALSPYQVEKLLGRGAMGSVYLARHRETGVQVAIKAMLPKTALDEHSRKVFQREINVASSLNHPNVVSIFEHRVVGDVFFIIMEYCAGGSIKNRAKVAGGKLELNQALSFLQQALTGLAYIHECGFVHRDLKPENLLLSDPEGGIVKISDFGLAKSFTDAGLSGMTITGAAAGTFPFMPREQLIEFKYAKPAGDVWSMAATFYYLLTGYYPLDFPRGEDPIVIVLRNRVVPIDERGVKFPQGFTQIMNRALAAREDRYSSAKEFLHALLSFITEWQTGKKTNSGNSL